MKVKVKEKRAFQQWSQMSPVLRGAQCSSELHGATKLAIHDKDDDHEDVDEHEHDNDDVDG